MLGTAVLTGILLFQQAVVSVEITAGNFNATGINLSSGAQLNLVNHDNVPYTIESPGFLAGDVSLEPGSQQTVKPLRHAGSFHVLIEENPSTDLVVHYAGSRRDPKEHRSIPFDQAKDLNRQPVVSDPGDEPEFATFATFDLAQIGESARQGFLQKFYGFQEQLSSPGLPPELKGRLTQAQWTVNAPSLSIVIGLGPSCFDKARFGEAVSAATPKELNTRFFDRLESAKSNQHDVLIRIASDDARFNKSVFEYLKSSFARQIVLGATSEGTSPKDSRSPILGGFFDGTGNPGGKSLEEAAFDPLGGTYLSLLKIRFDTSRFLDHTISSQEQIIGREKESGKTIATTKPSHRSLAQNDKSSVIVRQGFIYSKSKTESGLLFCSLQASLEPLRKILFDYMIAQKDPLLDYMHFEEAGIYYVPGSPRGSYPGSITPR